MHVVVRVRVPVVPRTISTLEPADCTRNSVPLPGSSLTAATEARAIHVRTAVNSLRRSYSDATSARTSWEAVLASRWREDPLQCSTTSDLRLAWALVSMRILGRSVGALSASASLREAEAWFLGSIRPPVLLSDNVNTAEDRVAVRSLEAIQYDQTFRDLLPYVLDAHGPGSRASVMKDPRTKWARLAKSKSGVYYTPSDVSDYIAREVVNSLSKPIGETKVLDPACGSGVFLRSHLDLAARNDGQLDRISFVERCIFGIDVNPLAVEAACFVLLHECLVGRNSYVHRSPWSLWHCIRCNLCVADALTIRCALPPTCNSQALSDLRISLDLRFIPPARTSACMESDDLLCNRYVPLGATFPALASGADAVIGNPPYARIGRRYDGAIIKEQFMSLSSCGIADANLFPLFVEMMWKLARPYHSASGMVVPLSLACSSRSQMTALRRAIVSSGGCWRFAFFDREPHALFGEEVKTRNAIALRLNDCRTHTPIAKIETGPLRRWNSRHRSEIFKSINFIGLKNEAIATGIPKLGCDQAASVYRQLVSRTTLLRHMCKTVTSCQIEDATIDSSRRSVFVSGTAYNYLNVFRSHGTLPPPRAPWSASKLLCLRFHTEQEAARAFAMVSSRIAYWLWQVTGDGFHVTRVFVTSLPLNDRSLSDSAKDKLSRLGEQLWEGIQVSQSISINGGRQTIAYCPDASDCIRDQIDKLLLETLDVAPSFSKYLRDFIKPTVAMSKR